MVAPWIVFFIWENVVCHRALGELFLEAPLLTESGVDGGTLDCLRRLLSSES